MAATGILVDLSPHTPTHGSPLHYDIELPWARFLDSELQITPLIQSPGRTSIFSPPVLPAPHTPSPLSPTLEDDDTPSKVLAREFAHLTLDTVDKSSGASPIHIASPSLDNDTPSKRLTWEFSKLSLYAPNQPKDGADIYVTPTKSTSMDPSLTSKTVSPSLSDRIKRNSKSPLGKDSLTPPIASESIVRAKTAEDFDESVSDSVSTLSSDTIPRQPLPTLSRLRPEQESEFFAELYNVLAIGFRMWEDRVGGDKADNYKLLQWNDRMINLPAIQERHVVMGRRQDGGFWSGNFILAGSDSVVVQLDTTIGLLPAVEIGWIRDFECRYGAMLFFARDKKVYYMDTEGDCGEDEEGNDIYWGHGPYDLRNFGTSHELNP